MIFKIGQGSCCKMFRSEWASPGGLLFKTGAEFLYLSRLHCGLDQAHANLFFSFIKTKILQNSPKIIEKLEKYQTSFISFIKMWSIHRCYKPC
jgi:hypothetical protein